MKFSVYLNRLVFVMGFSCSKEVLLLQFIVCASVVSYVVFGLSVSHFGSLGRLYFVIVAFPG